MARTGNGTTQYGSNAAAAVTAVPLSMAAWFKPASTGPAYAVSCLGHDGTTDRSNYSLTLLGSGSGNVIQARSQDSGGVIAAAASSAGYGAGWQHGVAVFTSTTSRAIYLNGGSKGTETTSNSPTTPNLTYLAVRSGAASNALNSWLNGDVAEIGFWNVALTDAEAAVLAAGYSPLFVRPANLVAYWPLAGTFSPELDWFGRFDLTLTASPAKADHPRIIYPPRRKLIIDSRRTLTGGASLSCGALSPAFGVSRTPALRTTAPALSPAALGQAWSASRTPAVRTTALAKTLDALSLGPGAGTRGPLGPSVGVDGGDLVGQVAWTNPGNVTASDDSRAVVTLASFQQSHLLQATGFGFAIPADSTVLGITLAIERSASSASKLTDLVIGLTKAGSADKADAVTFWPTADAVATYGGPSDLWSTTWTPAEVNSPAFGAVVACANTTGTTTDGRIDRVTITITLAAPVLKSTPTRVTAPVLAASALGQAWSASRTPAVRTSTPALAGGQLAVALSGSDQFQTRAGTAALVTVQLAAAWSVSRTPAVRTSTPALAGQQLAVALAGSDQFQTRTGAAPLVTVQLAAAWSVSRTPALRTCTPALAGQQLAIALTGSDQFQTRAGTAPLVTVQLAAAWSASRTPAVRTSTPALAGQQLAIALAGSDQFQTRTGTAPLAAQVLSCGLGGTAAAANTRLALAALVSSELVIAAAATRTPALRAGSAELDSAPLLLAGQAQRVAIERSCQADLFSVELAIAVSALNLGTARVASAALALDAAEISAAAVRTPALRTATPALVSAPLLVAGQGQRIGIERSGLLLLQAAPAELAGLLVHRLPFSPGPICVAALQVFVPGAAAGVLFVPEPLGEIFVPGARAASLFIPGAAAGQVSIPGIDRAQGACCD